MIWLINWYYKKYLKDIGKCNKILTITWQNNSNFFLVQCFENLDRASVDEQELTTSKTSKQKIKIKKKKEETTRLLSVDQGRRLVLET